MHIVASCSDRKAFPPCVRLRDFRYDKVSERYRAWRKGLRAAKGQRAPAQDLYQGEHWSVVRSLPAVGTASGWFVRLWVASAGYGVLENTNRVVSYSATFAPRHLDSVRDSNTDDAGVLAWWRHATDGRERLGRSVASIVDEDPKATVLLLASPSYLAAMAEDLRAASLLFRLSGALFIVSSGLPADAGSLSDCLVTSRATLQAALGGTLLSLHARAAAHLLRTVKPGAFLRENIETMSKDLEREMGGGPPRTVGTSMTDEEVRAFIRTRLKVEPKLTHTRLLRELRDSKRACEQGRFRRLFFEQKSSG